MAIKAIHLLPVILITSLLLLLIVYIKKRLDSNYKKMLLQLLDNNEPISTPLHNAAYHGHTKIVNKILSLFEGDTEKLMQLLSIKDKWGHTPLHWAAIKVHAEIVNKILSLFEGDTEKLMQLLSIKNNWEYTPLHLAAINGHAEIVNKILSAFENKKDELGELMSIKNHCGKTPLHLAAENDHAEIVNKILSFFEGDTANLLKLLSIKHDCWNTPLHWAAFNGHTEIVNKILSLLVGDTEKLMQLLSIQDDLRITPLHLAAIKSRTEIVNKILSFFEGDTANLLKLLSIKDYLQRTPLYLIAIKGHTEIVKMTINKLSPAEALQLLYETNYKGRNVYDDSEGAMKTLLNSIGANRTSNYLYINNQTITVSNKSFAAATHIVIPTDELKSSIPEKYHSKVINLTTKDIIEEAIKKAIENVVGKDDPISKELLKNEILIPDIISIITPYAITTIEILSLMESLRRVPYYGGGEKYQELLGFAARLLAKKPLLNFEAIKFTGNYDDDKGLLSFVEQMLTNNYQLKININGQEQVSNLSDHFEKYHNDLNISKESVDNILTEIPKQPKFSFEQFKLSLIKAAETQVPVIPAGEFEKKHRAMTSPGTK